MNVLRRTLATALAVVALTGCEDLFDTGGGSDDLSSHPLVTAGGANWRSSGGSLLDFNADGTGVIKIVDFAGICTPWGSENPFDWETSSSGNSGSVDLLYKSPAKVCGNTVSTPSPDRGRSYSISGGELSFAGLTWD